MPRPRKVTGAIADPNADPNAPIVASAPVELTERQKKNAEKKAAEAKAAEALSKMAAMIAPYVDSDGFISLYKYDHATGTTNTSANLNVHLSSLAPELHVAVEDFKYTQEKAMEAKRNQLDLFLSDPETLKLLEEKGFLPHGEIFPEVTIKQEEPRLD